jgi:hypothetical protein
MFNRVNRRRRSRGWFAISLIAPSLLTGCRQPAETTVTQPAVSQPAAVTDSVATSQPGESHAPAAGKPLEVPWAVFREAQDKRIPASMRCEWTGGRRLEISTVNVSLLTLDLTKLPPDAPKRGPWTLQIDQQGIEIYGKQGKVMELARSRNGDWTVVPDSQRTRQ